MSARRLFYLLNFGMLAAFAWAYRKDYDAEWKRYQKAYYVKTAEALERQAQSVQDPEQAEAFRAEAKSWRRRPLEIKQIIAKDFRRFDRCITCHVGMDEYANPTLSNDFAEHPYKAHPGLGTIAKSHPFTKYGCTVCHAGQGLAASVEDAHGFVHNWERPLLKGDLIQGSCVKCHANFETLKGAEVAAKGKQLFHRHGCQGCHSIRGAGGTISEPLEAVYDKPFERISLYHFTKMAKGGKPIPREEWNVQNWILGHLLNDPMLVVPNDPFAKYNAEPIAPSGMPDFREEVGEEGALALGAYLMSMTAESIPASYYVYAPPKPEPRFSDPLAHGKHVFQKYGCAGCHGLRGAQGRRNFNAMGPGQEDPEKDMDKGRVPTLVETVGTFTREELKQKISGGVSSINVNKFNPNGPTPPLYMPAWKDKIKDRELEDLATWLLSIAKKDESGF